MNSGPLSQRMLPVEYHGVPNLLLQKTINQGLVRVQFTLPNSGTLRRRRTTPLQRPAYCLWMNAQLRGDVLPINTPFAICALISIQSSLSSMAGTSRVFRDSLKVHPVALLGGHFIPTFRRLLKLAMTHHAQYKKPPAIEKGIRGKIHAPVVIDLLCLAAYQPNASSGPFPVRLPAHFDR